MQASNNSFIKDLNFVHREKALYETDVITIKLKNEDFEDFKNNTLDKHATWNLRSKSASKKPAIPGARVLTTTYTFRCDHHGSPQKPKKKGIYNKTRYNIQFTNYINIYRRE
jgi:hypothetical protein